LLFHELRITRIIPRFAETLRLLHCSFHVNRKIFILALVGIVATSAYWFFRSPTYKNFPPMATGEWIAFGDSLTAGYGGGEGKDFPALLSQQIGIPIHNLGMPGNTTRDGLNRLGDAVSRKPRVVLLCLGGNDELQSLPRDQMFSNLGAIIDQFHQAGSFVVLIGVHSASFRDTIGKRFKKLADEKEVLYVPDMLDGVLGSPNLMSDYIHPNDAGYQKIAERLAGVLMPLLPQLRG
jgi:acyl-CoA thioesterase-1